MRYVSQPTSACTHTTVVRPVGSRQVCVEKAQRQIRSLVTRAPVTVIRVRFLLFWIRENFNM